MARYFSPAYLKNAKNFNGLSFYASGINTTIWHIEFYILESWFSIILYTTLWYEKTQHLLKDKVLLEISYA